MNAALFVSADQEVSTHVPNADSAHEIWDSLDLLAEESAGSAKMAQLCRRWTRDPELCLYRS
jgi:hypothetical protein